MNFSSSQHPDRLWYPCCSYWINITDAFLRVKTSLVRQVHYFPPSRADVKSEHSYIANAEVCRLYIHRAKFILCCIIMKNLYQSTQT